MDTSARPHVNRDPIAQLLAEGAKPGWPPMSVLAFCIRLALRTQAGRAPIPSIPNS